MTLLEVMVAMAILAIAGVTIAQSASGHLRSLQMLEQNTYALWVADNQMADLVLTQDWRSAAGDKGTEQVAQQTFFWRWERVATSDPEFLALRVFVYESENLLNKRDNPIAQLQTYVWDGS
ncbi:type II secretion system protein GspI [Alginatibacterium sediminis]|uniref:Type II secretion system protein I n=2 Tax=Alginatibacterium sediminis TaxID=2164068 RepID=A0A420E6G4_9ALTE|nr:type II secretion system protein GspI [Alginatibacterium sediminis]